MRKPPRLYFSFRSPRSWLAVRQLTERWPDAPDVVTFVPHWVPDDTMRTALAEADASFLDTPVSRAKHTYLLVGAERLAQRFGYRMVWPTEVDVDWSIPHMAWLYAREHQRGWQFYQAMVSARWERGENISDPAVVAAAAIEAGVDPAGANAAACDPATRAQAVAALAGAYQDDIFAVPYFVVGRHRFWGLERIDGFLDAALAAGVRG
ncbi:DsbA family protein [Micromonospora tulbaghiae]|uniref:2-hydroxychromene-2-carboxylate isomerase n=1 Tax=Micromonospora tulbaghiae TaxID=479978 RepID=A0AAW4JEX9_9ACTN|nr:DsbA family protein [Micromonospora tulbaghiae]MBO4138585.1 DsbA family protein [Micromonospora tulbaghiae]MDX5458374.1 DsbA family protein [Micromonospora tulbaghiae]SCE74429.1 2-hydroxychromene-2-carboxylate isomerase [Micromonospora tulbaghiae]